MKIKLPGKISFVRGQHVEHVAESIVKFYLYVAFAISWVAWIKIYQIVFQGAPLF